MTQNEAMREAFEKPFRPEALKRAVNPNFYESDEVQAHWVDFYRGWQAALSTIPRVSEEELVNAFYEAIGRIAEKTVMGDLYPSGQLNGLMQGIEIARALFAKFPFLERK